jgi:hypothetical protein
MEPKSAKELTREQTIMDNARFPKPTPVGKNFVSYEVPFSGVLEVPASFTYLDVELVANKLTIYGTADNSLVTKELVINAFIDGDTEPTEYYGRYLKTIINKDNVSHIFLV